MGTGDGPLGPGFTESMKSPPLEARLPPYLQSITNGAEKGFPPKFSPHVISELFQVNEFAVISSEHAPVQNESELKVIMSSVCIALNNTNR